MQHGATHICSLLLQHALEGNKLRLCSPEEVLHAASRSLQEWHCILLFSALLACPMSCNADPNLLCLKA